MTIHVSFIFQVEAAGGGRDCRALDWTADWTWANSGNEEEGMGVKEGEGGRRGGSVCPVPRAGTAVKEREEEGDVNLLVVGADVLYQRESVEPLLNVISRLLLGHDTLVSAPENDHRYPSNGGGGGSGGGGDSGAGRKTMLLAYKRRSVGEDEFFRRLPLCGLSCRLVSSSDSSSESSSEEASIGGASDLTDLTEPVRIDSYLKDGDAAIFEIGILRP